MSLFLYFIIITVLMIFRVNPSPVTFISHVRAVQKLNMHRDFLVWVC